MRLVFESERLVFRPLSMDDVDIEIEIWTDPEVAKYIIGEAATKEDVANQKVNLLFFGNFHQMKLDEFEWAMNEMMKDRNYLYGSLTKDLYFLGLVLNRKYNILRLTYLVFIIGIIVSVIAFAVAFEVFEAGV